MPALKSDFSHPPLYLPSSVCGGTAQDDLSLVEELPGKGEERPITTYIQNSFP
jgi:hypothetical protein